MPRGSALAAASKALSILGFGSRFLPAAYLHAAVDDEPAIGNRFRLDSRRHRRSNNARFSVARPTRCRSLGAFPSRSSGPYTTQSRVRDRFNR